MNQLQATKAVRAAIAARNAAEARAVQDAIAAVVGARHQRPVGDRWNNIGILTASGSSYDHKVLEVATNMQDAVVELRALLRYKSLELVPYKTPHEAAADLLGGVEPRQRAGLVTMTLDDAGHGKKRVTVVARDRGCGISPSAMPKTIFQVGAGHKNGFDWLQGNFGLGGATTFRNAEAVVVVSRRHPELLKPGEEDVVAVAVVQWERFRTTESAFYLVTSEWTEPGDVANPLSVPASWVPEFEPGTHVALIGYGTEGLARRSGDERSFDTVLNTRLFRPVIPVRYQNNIIRDRYEYLYGLEQRLDDNAPAPAMEGRDTLPFSVDGTTYHLPLRFRIFARRGEPGERRKFVAYGHSVVITSNGQVHSHWSGEEFRLRTRLKKLYDRVLVVVESDALPLEVRTSLFTADRSQLVKTDHALRLEREIAAFLDEWAALVDANSALIREAIAGGGSDRPTLELARKIARNMKLRGFGVGLGTGNRGGKGGGRKPPEPTPPEFLYDDPTHFEGPEEVEVVAGRSRGIYFKLNAKDGFVPRRATFSVTCDHPDIGLNEVTTGELTGGRIRVSVSVPEGADLGLYKLTADVDDWAPTRGGLGQRMLWTTKLNVVAEQRPKPPGGGAAGSGSSGASEGNDIALLWKTEDDMEDWDAATVGEVMMVPAPDLAKERQEYSDLAALDVEVPTLVLNRTYSHLKAYIQLRAQDLTNAGTDDARDRYALGVGLAMLILHRDEERAATQGTVRSPSERRAALEAAARGVLSVLPEYDRLAKELDD